MFSRPGRCPEAAAAALVFGKRKFQTDVATCLTAQATFKQFGNDKYIMNNVCE